MHYLLFYDYVPDYLARREAFRAEHLQLAWQAVARGELIMAGVLDEPVDSAVLFFQVAAPQLIEAFVANDPYVKHGLVKHWRIRPWMTVVGEQAHKPVRPANT